jgi:colanic acid/amylovoran biosynthesis glycosyltransferase
VGTPVVVSDLPGLDEAISGPEHGGLVVESGDATALAAALERVLTDAGLRERLGTAAAARAQDYSVEAIGATYIELLRAACATPSGAGRNDT